MARRWSLFAGLLLAPLCLAPSVAFTQDLAALARQEKERRAKIAKPTKVFTEGDGKEGTVGAVTTVSPVTTAPPDNGAAASSGAASQDAASRAQWKARQDQVKGNLARAEEALKATESEIERVRQDMTPLSAAEAQDPMRQQKREAKLAEMAALLPKLKQAVAEAKQAIVDFETEARKSNVPPGWLR